MSLVVPILISSSSQNVQISEVLQTSQITTGTDDPSAQGSRSGVVILMEAPTVLSSFRPTMVFYS